MKKIVVIFFVFSFLHFSLCAQQDIIAVYKKTSAMIPMRDGVKLFTVILTPVNASADEPILIQRTPYGANRSLPDDTVFNISGNFQYANMAADGYIFVFQYVR